MSMSNPPPDTRPEAPVGVDLISAFVNTAQLEEQTDQLASVQQARDWLQELDQRFRVDWNQVGTECEPLARLARLSLGLPTLPG